CRSPKAIVSLGIVMGVATLVRPQSLVLSPCFGLLCTDPRARLALRVRAAAVATALALSVCAPWTIRNCMSMGQCALVSFNAGWNLLVGAEEGGTGGGGRGDVPEACRTVWDEAQKDACFGREARRLIVREPVRWFGLVPARLAATFDYAGAAGFYLHES